jgi:hypothetical protein
VIEPERRCGLGEVAFCCQRRDRVDRRAGQKGAYSPGGRRAVRRRLPVGDRSRGLPLIAAVLGVENAALGVTGQNVAGLHDVRSIAIEGVR